MYIHTWVARDESQVMVRQVMGQYMYCIYVHTHSAVYMYMYICICVYMGLK